MLIFYPQARMLYNSLFAFYTEYHCDMLIDINAGYVLKPNFHEAKRRLPLRGGELDVTLDFPIEKGYLAFDRRFYFLTYKGRFPKESRMESLLGFLLRSVAVPIIVSICTTIIALLLN